MTKPIYEELAATQSRWISVNERLPDHNVCIDVWGEILAGDDEGDSTRFENAFYDAEIGDFWKWYEKYYIDEDGESERMCRNTYFKNSIKVTHWMPLPPEPELCTPPPPEPPKLRMVNEDGDCWFTKRFTRGE